MKIIAKTDTGYIAEIEPQEIGRITGDGSHSVWHNEKFKPGAVLNVSDTYDHLERLLRNGEERKKIAESLRAAATLIEHTPSPITLPPEEPSPGAI